MSVYISPLWGAGGQLLTNQGVVLALGFISTYQAGSTTPIATYIDNTQTTQNAVAIPLDSAGRPPNEIWLLGGQAYKFIVTTAQGVQVGNAYDNIAGVNDPANGAGGGSPSAPLTVWANVAGTPTFISATQFSIPGNLTSTFPIGTRVKSTVTAGTSYGTVSASAFGAFTTVTLVNDGTTLDSGLSVVATSVNTVANPNVSAGAVAFNSAITFPAGSAGADLNSKTTSIATLTTNLAAATKAVATVGGPTAFTLTPVPAIASYVTGQTWLAQANSVSSGATTINISAQGVKNLKQFNAAGAKINAVMISGAIYELAYDGTDVMLMNPTPVSTGKLNRITNINTTSTWTKQADTNSVIVEVIGGGGGGGTGLSGGAGGLARTYVSAPGATESVVIGAGGIGTAAATPTAGAQSSFGTWAVATGGAVTTGAGGVGTTGDVNLTGNAGATTGNGGFAGGAVPAAAATANSGAGGATGGGTGFAGGSGRVIVYEYA